MATWQEMAHSVFTRAESVGAYIVKGIETLKDSKLITILQKAEPKIVPLVEKLAGVIPGIGTAEAIINVADWGVEHWVALQYLGALAHFAPADALNYEPFKNDTGDTGFSGRE